MRITTLSHLQLFIVFSCILFVNRTTSSLVAEERQFFEDLFEANPNFRLLVTRDNICASNRVECSADNSTVLGLNLNRQAVSIIPYSIANLTHIRRLDLSLARIGDQGIERLLPLSSLVQLNLAQTRAFELPPTFGYAFPNLEVLQLPETLVSIPIGFKELRNLRELIIQFANADHLPRICGLENLERLQLLSANVFTVPECFNTGLPRLRNLALAWSTLRVFPDVFGMVSLEELHIPMTTLNTMIPRDISKLKNLRVLNLHSAGLIGPLPDTIGDLLQLEELALGDNALLSTIPPSIGRLTKLRQLVLTSNGFVRNIPDEICNLESLQNLNLGNNQLSGAIPNCIGKLKRLQNLMLSHNTLDGTLPSSIGALTNLTTLQLNDNQLTGTLPEEIGNLSQLDIIAVDNNQFVGTFPASLQNLQRLLIFHASFNNFEGPLFNISNMPRLEFCEVQFNSLTGQLPDSFTGDCDLSHFQAQSNNFTGTLPQTLQNLNALQQLNLGNNRISGTIPELLFSQPARLNIVDLSDNFLTGTVPPISGRLRSVFLENNKLHGSIPPLTNATVLNFIDLSNNMLDGTLPPLPQQLLFASFASNALTGTFPAEYIEIPGLSTLDLSSNAIYGGLPRIPPNIPFRHLDLSRNQMNGTIPAALISQSIQTLILSYNQFGGTLPTYNSLAFNLHTLRLNNNRITGNVPRAQFALVNLEVLDLSGNNLRGNLPAITQRLRRLRIMNISYNFLSGVLPPSLSNIVNLEELDLSVNEFIGTIPSQLGTLSSLRTLNLGLNHLTGGIPISFAGHEALTSLSLAANQLSGTIPTYIGELFNLQRLDLSLNDFSGTIPESLELLRGLHYLDLGKNRLSGEIPVSLFALQRLRRLELDENDLSGTIPKEIVNARLLEVINLRQNKLSGTLPPLWALTEVTQFHISSNNLVGCVHLPRIFDNSRNNSNVACSIDQNRFCCSRRDYICSTTDYCPLDEALVVANGDRLRIKHRYNYYKLVVEEGATLVITPETKLEIECATVLGTIEVDISDLEEDSIDVSFLSYSCGETDNMKVTAVGIGKKCEVSSTTIENVDSKRQFTAKVNCPNNLLPEGTIIAIIVSVTGGFIMVIVIGGVTYRYFRGKRRVEQLLNRVELLTLTTKNGGDDQFSLPQWHAPEDYTLKPIEDLPIQVSNTKFDFGTKGNLLQVDSTYKDSFRVQSRTKINQSRGLVQRLLEKSLRVNFHPVQSTKYQLTMDPFEIDIRDKGYVDVTLMLQMRMTTRTNISLWVEVPELKQFSLLEFVCASEPSPWIDIDEVDGVTEALGEGGFGAVYKAKYRGQTIAFKKLKFQEMNIQQFEEFNREVQMMMNLHHRCIVQFIGASKVPGKLAILTEFVSGGNLQELLNSRPLDTGLKLKIALDIAEALQFLHANNILHRDIKAENVLVASTAKEASVNVKLTDFGTARSIVEEVTMKFTKGIGTPSYMAPGTLMQNMYRFPYLRVTEILENKRYEKGADIYSFGILLWTIMSQQQPYSHLEQPWQVANMVIAGERLPIPPNTPITVAELINKCWAQSPDDRPSMDQVVKELDLILGTKM